jgi:hypothetical protein
LLLALSLLMILLERSPAEEFPWQAQAINVVGTIGAPILGGLVASRRPGNPYGWIWLGYGMGFVLAALADAYLTYAAAAADSGSVPVPWPIALIPGLGWGVSIVLVPFLLLLFPDGRLPSPRWRFVAWTAAATGTSTLILVPFRPIWEDNPLTIGGSVGEAIAIVSSAGVVVIFVAIVLSALSLVFRYRRATGVQRQQLKWFAYAATVLSAWIVVDVGDWFGVSEALLGGPFLTLFTAASFTGLYVAVGIAVLKYRLYDIDVLINRTLVYGALTATLALVYLGGVATTQTIFRLLSGQEEQPQLAVVASTLVIAALFSPLRRRVQAFVDRRFYRRKYDAAKTLEAFSSKLRDETDLDWLGEELVSVVRGTVQPEHASLWLRDTEDGR